jgi:hypothetical protein
MLLCSLPLVTNPGAAERLCWLLTHSLVQIPTCPLTSLQCLPLPMLLLQICITVFFLASVTLRGVTVVDANPYSLPFVCLWLANVAVGSGLILVVSAILVWVPVYDGRLANARLGGLCAVSTVICMLLLWTTSVMQRPDTMCVPHVQLWAVG